jgi:hypothetical protein
MKKETMAGLVAATVLCFANVAHAAEWRVLEEAREIVDIGNVLSGKPYLPVQTYKSADDPAIDDDNEISEEDWKDYVLQPPLLKNTTRNLQFNESQFLASPGAPLGVTTYIQTLPDGQLCVSPCTATPTFTWAAMSEAINALWPYDPLLYEAPSNVNEYFAGNFVVTPPPGVVKITANYKGQNMKFWAYENGARPGRNKAVALERYFVTDQWGNDYIMHASGREQAEVRAAFESAVLPPGWRKSIRRLGQDLILRPAQSDDPDARFHYLVIRDSADNTYHQIGWGKRGSLMAQVDGMPIWGGRGRDILTGDVDGIRDDVMYGGGGGDLFRPGRGDNVIWGSSAAVDTVELQGRSNHYDVERKDAATLVLRGLGETHTLHHIDRLRFANGVVEVEAI